EAVGAGLAKARHRAVNQTRIDLAQAFIVEAVAFQIADLVVLEQDVRLRCQPSHELLALWLRDIDGHGLLVAVRADVHGAERRIFPALLVFHEWWAEVARIIAFSRPLDLDDIGTEIAQHLAGPWRG